MGRRSQHFAGNISRAVDRLDCGGQHGACVAPAGHHFRDGCLGWLAVVGAYRTSKKYDCGLNILGGDFDSESRAAFGRASVECGGRNLSNRFVRGARNAGKLARSLGLSEFASHDHLNEHTITPSVQSGCRLRVFRQKEILMDERTFAQLSILNSIMAGSLALRSSITVPYYEGVGGEDMNAFAPTSLDQLQKDL